MSEYEIKYTNTPNHCQHVADYYKFRNPIRWDCLMRDALGVERLPLSVLFALYDWNAR